ncbi:MAG: MarR family transcriptional regulator [Lachnospiraceae bacterium]|nr:MarR family transcriptional regulator [Lachnospiraceae bacterium]
MDEKASCEGLTATLNHKIMDAFMKMGKHHRSVLEKRLQETGVYRGQHHLLMCIARNPDASQKELAKCEHVSTAAVAVALKKLEKGGYIERVVDAKDNRYNNTRITEKGLGVVSQSIRIFKQTEDETFAGFTEEEKQQFLNFLTRAGENMRNAQAESEDKEDEAL